MHPALGLLKLCIIPRQLQSLVLSNLASKQIRKYLTKPVPQRTLKCISYSCSLTVMPDSSLMSLSWNCPVSQSASQPIQMPLILSIAKKVHSEILTWICLTWLLKYLAITKKFFGLFCCTQAFMLPKNKWLCWKSYNAPQRWQAFLILFREK